MLAGASDKRQRPGCNHRKRRTSTASDLSEAPGRGGRKPASKRSPRPVSPRGKFLIKRMSVFMKAESADSQNESTESPWPRVPRITSEEFQQSVAVAQLAVKLCELERANPTVKQDDKPNLRPEKFLDDSWKLIEKAREHVLRSESCEEYLARHAGSLEAGEAVVRRIVQDVRIRFRSSVIRSATRVIQS